MYEPMIMVSSVTYALKGQRLLASHGIKSKIERTPKRNNNQSCGYSIIVNINKIDEAEQLLVSSGIKILGRIEGGSSY